MGQIAKPVGSDTTRYYWYPGERIEWIRAALAVLAGLLAFAVVGLLSRSLLAALTVGGSVTAVLAGVNFGRRDLRGMRDFPVRALAGRSPAGSAAARAVRRAAVRHASRAGWRATVQGVGGAALALLIANLPEHGSLADWVLPVVPVLLGALAHQAGMVYERLAQVGPPTLPSVPDRSAALRPSGTAALPTATAGGPPARIASPPAPPAGPALRLTSYRGQPPTGTQPRP